MVELVPSFKHALLEEAHGVYKLEIYKPTQRDSGKYICRATNNVAEEDIVHNVHFIGKPLHFHMHGIQSLNNAYLKEREHAAKQAMEDALRAKDEYELRRSGGLTPAFRKDDGPPVALKDRLKLSTHLRDRIALVGSKVKLAVAVLGPDPNIRWYKDGNPLVYGSHVKMMTSEGLSTLDLEKLTVESTGEYKLEARNDSGSEVTTSCYLKVYEARVKGDKEPPLFVLSLRGEW